jgi:hypothetical protein
MDKDTKVFGIRIPITLMEALKLKAVKERRSAAAMAKVILEDALGEELKTVEQNKKEK